MIPHRTDAVRPSHEYVLLATAGCHSRCSSAPPCRGGRPLSATLQATLSGQRNISAHEGIFALRCPSPVRHLASECAGGRKQPKKRGLVSGSEIACSLFSITDSEVITQLGSRMQVIQATAQQINKVHWRFARPSLFCPRGFWRLPGF